MSNFLGDAPTQVLTYIRSTAEMIAREGIEPHVSMHFREGDRLSVFLVLPSHGGEYKEAWHSETENYTFEGHDSKTLDGGQKTQDQLLMYADGKVTQNGKFFRAANEFIDGIRSVPLQIQVYEKIDAGVWFDKGIFNLMRARKTLLESRAVFVFELQPADFGKTDRDLDYFSERMIPVVEKVRVWKRDHGRCVLCGNESGLRFTHQEDDVAGLCLMCPAHRGQRGFLG